MTALSCQNLSYSYGQKTVLKNVSLKVPQGSLVGLVGHNGSGKSTLLKILQGLLPIQSGIITIDGHAVVQNQTLNAQQKRSIGVVFQECSSDDKLSAQENLYLAGGIYGLRGKLLDDRVHECLTQMRLIDRAKEPLKNFSHGMKRKLEIYRAFLHRPRFLLFDEATAGLDFFEVKNFYGYLKAYLKSHNAQAIIASHHAHEASFWDQCALMYEGEIRQQGSLQAIFGAHEYLCLDVEAKDESDREYFRSLGFAPKSENSPIWSLSQSSDEMQNLFKSGELLKKAHSLTLNQPNLATVYDRLRDGDDHA